MGCNMIVVGPIDESRTNLKGFGFFSNSVYDDETGAFLGCVKYSEYLSKETKDMGFELARIFAALLGTFITLATFVCLLVQCFNKHGKSCLWAVMTWSYIAAFLCQGGVFLIMMTNLCDQYQGEDSQCLLGSDGILSIVNGILLFGMVIATCNSSPPRNPVFRCWYAVAGELDTDESEEAEEESEDVEDPKSEKKKTGSKKRRSDDNESVSLFGSNHSKKSWLSLGPKLSVREHARRLEGKNLWPMNQLKTGAPSPKVDSRSVPHADEPMVDPRVRTYYRTQRNIFKRFENTTSPDDTLKKVDTLQTSSDATESATESTIESLKSNTKTTGGDIPTNSFKSSIPTAPQSQFIVDSRSYVKPVASNEKEDGVQTPLAEAYLRHVRARQSENRTTPQDKAIKERVSEEVASMNSESVKSASVKSGSVKSGSVKSVSVKSGGSVKSGSVKTATSRSNESARKSVKSNASSESLGDQSSQTGGSSACTFLVEQLAQSVILGKGGVRKEKTTFGKTMKIVDEYPAPAESKSKGKEKKAGAPIVKVRTEYCPQGRKTVMDELRPDGSRVVTTLIDPLTIDEELGM